MNFKNILAKVKTKLGAKPVWMLNDGDKVELGFIAGGVEYYRIKDVFNTFTMRGMAAIDVYDKFNMRMDRELLKGYVGELKNIFSGKASLNLPEAMRVLNSMDDRLSWVLPPQEYMWELLAVCYFDKNETPYSYDPEYQKQKIAKWKKSGEVSDFFLYTKLSELMPLPKLSEADLKTACTVIAKLDQINTKAA